MAAEDIAARLTGWKEIYDAFERYSHCDDGSIAEGFTDSIVRQLATHWETLPQGALIASQKPTFHTFVLRHINDTADISDLKLIARLANNQCPKGHDSMCSAIFQAATVK